MHISVAYQENVLMIRTALQKNRRPSSGDCELFDGDTCIEAQLLSAGMDAAIADSCNRQEDWTRV